MREHTLRFLDVPREFSLWEKAKVVIFPVPYEATTSWRKGTKNAPGAIIEASHQVELYDEEVGEEPYRVGIFTSAPLEIVPPEPQRMLREVKRGVKKVIERGKFPLLLGGEHTITLGGVQAVKEKYPRVRVLSLDAHADLRDSYQGKSYSHACVMRRVSEIGKLVEFGVRSISQEEVEYLKKKRIKIIFSREFLEGKWKEVLEEEGREEIYLSIDMDVFDPGVVPGVGYPEPGGVGWYEMLSFLRFLAQRKKIVGMDVVELSPLPGNPVSEFVAAKLIYKTLGYIFSKI